MDADILRQLAAELAAEMFKASKAQSPSALSPLHRLETVKVKSPTPVGYKIINKSYFDPNLHELFDAPPRPPTPPSGIRMKSAANAEEACVTWIRERVKDCLLGLSTPPRDKPTAKEEAREVVLKIGKLSDKAFERAWAIAAPAEWKKAGAKPGTRPL